MPSSVGPAVAKRNPAAAAAAVVAVAGVTSCVGVVAGDHYLRGSAVGQFVDAASVTPDVV